MTAAILFVKHSITIKFELKLKAVPLALSKRYSQSNIETYLVMSVLYQRRKHSSLTCICITLSLAYFAYTIPYQVNINHTESMP